MSSTIKLSDVIGGGSVDLLFFGTSGPFFISGGHRYSIELRVSDNVASLYLVSVHEAVEICRGNVEDISRTYNELLDELRSIKGRSSTHKKNANFFIGTALGFVAASAIAILATSFTPSVKKNELPENAIFELLEMMKDKTATQAGLTSQNLIPGNLPSIQQIAPQLQSPEVPTIVSPIVDRPHFLKSPVQQETAPSEPMVDTEANLPEEDPEFVIPTFDPEAYKAAAGLNTSPTKETAAPEQNDVVEDVETAVEPAPTEATEDKAIEESQAPVSEPKYTENATEEQSEKSTQDPQEPTSDKMSEAEFVPPPIEDTQKRANQVVTSLLNNGMTAGRATDVLKTLEALSQADFSEITPEMFASLPHEVAQMLRDNGLVDSLMEPGTTDGVPHRIIRLPDETLDLYRGKDGIPTIPEANTWAATGNTIVIPFPGGGDISKKEDFAAFGIKLENAENEGSKSK